MFARHHAFIWVSVLLLGSPGAANAMTAVKSATVSEIFSAEGEASRVMSVEAAIARAQAKHGVIPQSAAREISEKASLEFAPLGEIAEANARLRHRMEALLFVWRSRLSEDARESLHFGTTTVDIYDTTLSLQVSEALGLLMARNERILQTLSELALEHKDTPMAGRTLGQHALAMTFGKKVSVWIGELDRHQQRLCEVRGRIDRSMILKGPVGSYAGLGPQALLVEFSFASELGKPAPFADDWHGARDVYAEVALDIALLARSLARLGQEVFLLQSTDVRELQESLSKETVSSSSMPQKVNPVRSEALIHFGRTLSHSAEVFLDDVVNFYERDNTSRPNALMGEFLIEADHMLETAEQLLSVLDVDESRMRANLEASGALLRAQAVVQALTPEIGREKAASEVKAAALESHKSGKAFEDSLMERPLIQAAISAEALSELLNPFADLEGASKQVEAVVAASRRAAKEHCGQD